MTAYAAFQHLVIEAFLGSVKSGTSVLYFPPRHSLKLSDGFAYPTFSLLGRTHPSVRIPYPTASPGLPGYLILFATHALVHQRQLQSGKLPSLSEF